MPLPYYLEIEDIEDIKQKIRITIWNKNSVGRGNRINIPTFPITETNNISWSNVEFERFNIIDRNLEHG